MQAQASVHDTIIWNEGWGKDEEGKKKKKKKQQANMLHEFPALWSMRSTSVSIWDKLLADDNKHNSEQPAKVMSSAKEIHSNVYSAA